MSASRGFAPWSPDQGRWPYRPRWGLRPQARATVLAICAPTLKFLPTPLGGSTVRGEVPQRGPGQNRGRSQFWYAFQISESRFCNNRNRGLCQKRTLIVSCLSPHGNAWTCNARAWTHFRCSHRQTRLHRLQTSAACDDCIASIVA